MKSELKTASSTGSSITPINYFASFPIATNPGLWTKICKKLDVQVDNVLKKHQEILLTSLKDYQTSGPWVVQEISRMTPEAVVSNLTKMLIETINSGKPFFCLKFCWECRLLFLNSLGNSKTYFFLKDIYTTFLLLQF